MEINTVIYEGLDIVSKILLMDAVTAPKSVGRDDIVIEIVVNIKERKKILDKAKQISQESQFSFYARDAENCKDISHIILIGYKIFYHNFNCGFCGFNTCEETKKQGGVCAISTTDAGIAIGSIVKLASFFGIDNRVMLSIGKAAKEIGYFKENIAGAYGIPLSISTKNPFFDRSKK